MKRRGSKDHNHGAVADTFTALGCTVADCAHAGIPGWPDLVVGCMGVNHLVEIKNKETAYGRKGLNPEQSAFNNSWRGEKVTTACTADDATALVMHWRAVGSYVSGMRRNLLGGAQL